MGERIRVMIADDQRPTRKGLRALLTLYPEVELVGEAADGPGSCENGTRMLAGCRVDGHADAGIRWGECDKVDQTSVAGG